MNPFARVRSIPLPEAPAPVEALARLRGWPHRVLLESAGGTGPSYLAANPVLTLSSREGRTTVERAVIAETRELELEGADPFSALERLLEYFDAEGWRGGEGAGGARARARSDAGDAERGGGDDAAGGSPWTGGCIGYLGYEAGDVLEDLPSLRLPSMDGADDSPLPESWFGVYPWSVVWNPGGGSELRGRLLPGMDPRSLEAELERVAAALSRPDAEAVPTPAAERLVPSPAAGRPVSSPAAGRFIPRQVAAERPVPPLAAAQPSVSQVPRGVPLEARPDALSSLGGAGFRKGVERIREYIRAGDLFQANLTHRITRQTTLDGEALLQRLRRESPAPYLAFLDTGRGEVVSVSPESFLSVRGRSITTRPIKGTAPRGESPEEDRRCAARLERSEKDRAENVMIVDLLRNDLSRVCVDGTVEVPELCVLESHPTVHHLVSTVRGRLREGQGLVELLRATFPGGSITGAPKIRAIEILRELEPVARGVYTGALGMLTFGGDAELSIAIRTATVCDGLATYGTGGGITLDSDPEEEWQETLAKAAAFLRATDA